tara:strand:- start:512 stop:877 length:366 start_codon:yes stop_codon:yes gene_type:complete
MPNKTIYGNHHDTEVVVIRGKNAQKNKGHEKKKKYVGNSQMKKLDESTEANKIKKVNSKISQAIIKERSNKKWNRKQLAQQINEKESVIEEFETGKAKYNIKIIQKFERKLGIKLTGNEFK